MHTDYWVRELHVPGKPKLAFYIPDSLNPSYCVLDMPGFANGLYEHFCVGRLFARNGVLFVSTEWDDGGRFTEETMTESVDWALDTIQEFSGIETVNAMGMSYGASKLIRRLARETKEVPRINRGSAVQPPETILKYAQHRWIYQASKNGHKKQAVLAARLFKKDMHVRTLEDQERIISFIDAEPSLFEVIAGSNGNYRTPTQLIGSYNDPHVEFADGLQAIELVSQKGVETNTRQMENLDPIPTWAQQIEIFHYARQFFEQGVRAQNNATETPQLLQHTEPPRPVNYAAA